VCPMVIFLNFYMLNLTIVETYADIGYLLYHLNFFQEDFLKWKGVLFFRFIMTLLDTNKEISEFGE
jgi:hypothetical protein